MRHATNAAVVSAVVLMGFAARAAGEEPPMAEPPRNYSRYVYPGKDGRLVYPALDQWGNRFPDYSYAGYEGGGVQLPLVEVKLTLEPDGDQKDDTARIQAAIDKLSAMPRGKDGFRGALLLKAGQYVVAEALAIEASGVVIRGEGQNEKTGTVILCTKEGERGSMGWSKYGWKHTLLRLGTNKRSQTLGDTRQEIIDERVPLGARSFTLGDAGGYKVGDRIEIRVMQNAKSWKDWVGYPHWIRDEETGGKKILIHYNNHRARKALRHPHDRIITKIDGNRITTDVPLYNPIAKANGGGQIVKAAPMPERIDHVGVENLRLVSDWKPQKPDPDKPAVDMLRHAENAVAIYHTEDFWIRDVTSAGFLGHHFSPLWGAKRGTVVDCSALNPDPKFYQSYRYVARYGFHIGAQTLVFRCYVTNSRHSFNSGEGAGPRVFLDCLSEGNQGGPGPHMGFVNGDLFDNVRNADTELQISTRGQHQWRGINSTMWNCGAAAIVCMMPPRSWPPIGYNWAIGCYQLPGTEPERVAGHRDFYRGKGELLLRANAQIGDGVWESFGTLVEPRSLYEKQLEDRLGVDAVINTRYRIDWNKAFGRKVRSRTGI